MRLTACLLALLLAGCARMPDLGPTAQTPAQGTVWPKLTPMAEVQAAAASVTDADTLNKSAAGLDSRATALKARAKGLTPPPIDPATQAKLNAASQSSN